MLYLAHIVRHLHKLCRWGQRVPIWLLVLVLGVPLGPVQELSHSERWRTAAYQRVFGRLFTFFGSAEARADSQPSISDLPPSGVLTSQGTAGILYGLSGEVADPQLIQIDTATGQGTAIGSLGFVVADVGLAFDPIKRLLSGVSGSGVLDQSFSVDPQTGVGTLTGPLGIVTAESENDPGLAFDPCTQTLYMAEQETHEPFTLNTSTGRATVIGPLGINIENVGLAFNPASQELFGVSLNQLLRIDPTTDHKWPSINNNGDMVWTQSTEQVPNSSRSEK